MGISGPGQEPVAENRLGEALTRRTMSSSAGTFRGTLQASRREETRHSCCVPRGQQPLSGAGEPRRRGSADHVRLERQDSQFPAWGGARGLGTALPARGHAGSTGGARHGTAVLQTCSLPTVPPVGHTSPAWGPRSSARRRDRQPRQRLRSRSQSHRYVAGSGLRPTAKPRLSPRATETRTPRAVRARGKAGCGWPPRGAGGRFRTRSGTRGCALRCGDASSRESVSPLGAASARTPACRDPRHPEGGEDGKRRGFYVRRRESGGRFAGGWRVR